DQRVGGPRIQRPQLIEIQQASEPLIRERGVSEAVAQNDSTVVERGTDDSERVLAARRSKKQNLGDRIDARAAVEEYRADPIRYRRPSRLLRHDRAGNAIGNAPQLRRLAGALDAFECDAHRAV